MVVLRNKALRNKLASGRLSCAAAAGYSAQGKHQNDEWATHYASTLPSTLAHSVPCTTQSGAIRIRGALTDVGEAGVPICAPAPMMISASASTRSFTQQFDATRMVRV